MSFHNSEYPCLKENNMNSKDSAASNTAVVPVTGYAALRSLDILKDGLGEELQGMSMKFAIVVGVKVFTNRGVGPVLNPQALFHPRILAKSREEKMEQTNPLLLIAWTKMVEIVKQFLLLHFEIVELGNSRIVEFAFDHPFCLFFHF